jgi:hypothetical protein
VSNSKFSESKVIALRARDWLIDYGEDPLYVATMKPRHLRREMNLAFGPTGWWGFKREAERSMHDEPIADIVSSPTSQSSIIEAWTAPDRIAPVAPTVVDDLQHSDELAEPHR